MRKLPQIKLTTEESIKIVEQLIKYWKKNEANFEPEEVVALNNLIKIAKKDKK